MNEAGSPIYQLTLLLLSVYVLSALVAEAFFIKDPEIKTLLQYVDFAICLIFLLDFFLNVYRSKNRLAYLKWGWIDLLASIPAIDPLRWGRAARIIRILRYFRAIKSVRILLQGLNASKFETLTFSVFLIVFLSFTLASAFILEFEKDYGSNLNTAEGALWWAFLNIMNAKASIDQAVSPEGVVMTTFLNKIGLLLFAYINSMIVAWLVLQRRPSAQRAPSRDDSDD